MADLLDIHARIDRDRKASQPDARHVRIYRNYAKGRHDPTLTLDQLRALEGVINRDGHALADNVCKMILQAVTSRLQLALYQVDADPVSAWLGDWWVTTQLPLLAQQVHWATARDGNHAVTLAWDNLAGRVRLAREPWWDGKSGIWISYDDQDQPQYAVKEFTEATPTGKQRVRITYQRDRITRWVAAGAGWRVAPDTVDADGHPLPADAPWVDAAGAPLGLPLVHFRNVTTPADTDDSDGSYGVSELAGGIIGLQDEINDIQRDITIAARLQGFAVITATGVTFPKDDQGNTLLPTVQPGMILHTSAPNGAWGILPPGDLAQLERAHAIKLRAISRVSSTPLHLITGGDWPSGVALMQADQPLIRKVEAIGRALAPAWASLAHKATVLSNAFGGTDLDTTALISIQYKPADGLDPLTRAQVAAAEAPFVSEEDTLQTLDKTPAQREAILAARQQEQTRKTAQAVQIAGAQAQAAPALPMPMQTGRMLPNGR